MQQQTPVQEPYEAPTVEDLTTDGPSSVCSIVVVSGTD
jgi:hypothetical protein